MVECPEILGSEEPDEKNNKVQVLFVFSDRVCLCTAKRTMEVALALHQYANREVNSHVIYYQNLTAKEFVENDVIVFQRLGANSGIVTSTYQKQLFGWMDQYRDQTTYVYDIDDYIFEAQNGFPISFMKRCHWALAPNEFILSKMIVFQPNCHIIRTHVDLQSMEVAPKADFPTHLTNIGWFSTSAQGLGIIDAFYPKLLEKWEGKVLIHAYVHEYYVPILNDRFEQRMIVPHAFVPIMEMYSLEKGLDILINPLNIHKYLAPILGKKTEEEKLDFINSKSEIKYAHAGAAKKPLIATPNPSYCKAITHGVTGFLAETPEEWLKYLDLLITQPETREQIGHNAYRHVCEKYTYKQVAQNYAQFFRELKYPPK